MLDRLSSDSFRRSVDINRQSPRDPYNLSDRYKDLLSTSPVLNSGSSAIDAALRRTPYAESP